MLSRVSPAFCSNPQRSRETADSHLAGVHLPLQEAGTDHLVSEGEVVEEITGLLVYDAHRGFLQDLRLGGCMKTTGRVSRAEGSGNYRLLG